MSFRRAYRIKTNYPVIGVKLIHRAGRFMAEIGNFELKPLLGFSTLSYLVPLDHRSVQTQRELLY
jgi:hypothetical protein